MRWVLKAGLQKVLSSVPASEQANYLLQRHVTRALPAGDDALLRKFRRARSHLTAYLEHGASHEVSDARFYEFGAGWDLAMPLSYYCLGIDRQILVDIRTNVRLELVRHTLARLGKLLPELEKEVGRKLRNPGSPHVRSTPELEERFGIVYLAPRDARETRLEAGSVDFASSTNTLEHVPEHDVVPLLVECRRLLRPDGILSCRIDLRDHFAYFDPGITAYNFLRFSERAWRIVNSRLLYQSRLRYPDYTRYFAQAGFDILAEVRAGPNAADMESLRRVHVHPELLERCSLEELAVKALSLVARPTPGSPDLP